MMMVMTMMMKMMIRSYEPDLVFEKDRLFATEGLRLEDNKELVGADTGNKVISWILPLLFVRRRQYFRLEQFFVEVSTR